VPKTALIITAVRIGGFYDFLRYREARNTTMERSPWNEPLNRLLQKSLIRPSHNSIVLKSLAAVRFCRAYPDDGVCKASPGL